VGHISDSKFSLLSSFNSQNLSKSLHSIVVATIILLPLNLLHPDVIQPKSVFDQEDGLSLLPLFEEFLLTAPIIKSTRPGLLNSGSANG